MFISYFGDKFILLQKSNVSNVKSWLYFMKSIVRIHVWERQCMHLSQLFKFPQIIIGFWDRTDWGVTWNFCFDHSIYHLMGTVLADVNSSCWLFGYIIPWRAPAKGWVIILKWHAKLLNESWFQYIWIDMRKPESSLVWNISIAYLSNGKYINELNK